jgi:predicted Zn finger-like uncharacterized protein
MYTRCPECHTTFKVTPAQLNAHEGLVRCGICSHTFHADQGLFETFPEEDNENSPTEDEAPSLKKPKRKRVKKKKAAAPAKHHKKKKDGNSPEISGLPWQKNRGSRVKISLWTLGNMLLLLLLAGQYTFFYRDALARVPQWNPLVHKFCHLAHCEIEPPHNIKQVELLQTTIAPHPEYENALRLRATLVNRAEFDQEYPDMEVSLTDSAGLVVARQVFSADQYLETPAAANDPMFQNVAMAARLDVTNPDGKAVGYEIRLVNP